MMERLKRLQTPSTLFVWTSPATHSSKFFPPWLVRPREKLKIRGLGDRGERARNGRVDEASRESDAG